MEKYILPPQFDFINYPDKISPVTMYFFEFSYTFDKDDLSYMWQNLMPRNHEKGFFKSAVAQHKLGLGGPLDASDILDNDNIRWMVFKVKQRSQADYYDYVSPQAGSHTLQDRDDDSPLQFNWPYDFCSIVECVNLNTEVLFNNRPETPGKNTTVMYQGSISSDLELNMGGLSFGELQQSDLVTKLPGQYSAARASAATGAPAAAAGATSAAPAAAPAAAPSRTDTGRY